MVSLCACPTRGASTARCASTGIQQTPTSSQNPLAFHSLWGSSLVDPRLRASNEHILIVRILQARRMACVTAPSSPSKLAGFPFTGGWPAWAPTACLQRGPSQAARCASKEDHQSPSPPSDLADLAHLTFSGPTPVSGLTAAVERAHSHRARSGSKRPARVSVLPLFLRVPPRIPCRNSSPLTNRALPLSSEPLNIPQLSSSFLSSSRRHSHCSSI